MKLLLLSHKFISLEKPTEYKLLNLISWAKLPDRRTTYRSQCVLYIRNTTDKIIYLVIILSKNI